MSQEKISSFLNLAIFSKPVKSLRFLVGIGGITIALNTSPALAQSSSKDIKTLENFFDAKGVIIGKTDQGLWICSEGLPYFRKDFPVAIYSGTSVENPLTGKKIFVIIKKTGEGVIAQSFKENSLIKALKDNGIKIGNIVKLKYQNICFSGSEESFSKLAETLPVVKGSSNCSWTIKETSNRFSVWFKNNEIFYVKKELPAYAYQVSGKATLNDITIVAKVFPIISFNNDIPMAIDSGKLLSSKAEFVVIGFPDRISIYQKINGDLNLITDLPTPAGTLVDLQVVYVKNQGLIIGNMITSDGQPSAFVVKMIGSNAVIVQKNIPYFIAVLDKKRPSETLILQEFKNGGFGKVYKGYLDSRGIIEKSEELKTLPEDFRADSAVIAYGDILAYIDTAGTFRIYKGNLKKGFTHIMDIDGDFGNSYKFIDIPNVMGDVTLKKFFFHPRPVPIQLFGFKGFLVAKNIRTKIVPILGDKFVKFSKGKLYFIAPEKTNSSMEDIYEAKPLIGGIFSDAIQGITLLPDGTPYLISGKINPLLFKEEGKVYRIDFRFF